VKGPLDLSTSAWPTFGQTFFFGALKQRPEQTSRCLRLNLIFWPQGGTCPLLSRFSKKIFFILSGNIPADNPAPQMSANPKSKKRYFSLTIG